MQYENKNGLCVIYKASFPSGKSYIGQSWNFAERRRQHRKRTDCAKFAAARDKYGWDSIVWEVLAECDTQSAADYLEKHYITLYDSIDNGYNLKTGGKGGKHSEETKRKCAAGNLGRKHNDEHKRKVSAFSRGRPKSAGHKRKISESNRGRKHSDEHKRKLREAWKKRAPMTDETKRKMSIAQTKRWDAYRANK